MKRLLPILRILCALGLTAAALLWLFGCDRQARAQAGADATAGLRALEAALVAGEATADVLAILHGVEKYIPAATGVNPSEWPKPRMSPQEIRAAPADYDKSAPPVPEPSVGVLGWLLGAAPVVLWIVGRLAPAFPVLGPMAGKIADGAWALLASRNQKAADQAQATVQSAAAHAAPVLDALRSLPPDALPPGIRQLLDSPVTVQALHYLAGERGKA